LGGERQGEGCLQPRLGKGLRTEPGKKPVLSHMTFTVLETRSYRSHGTRDFLGNAV